MAKKKQTKKTITKKASKIKNTARKRKVSPAAVKTSKKRKVTRKETVNKKVEKGIGPSLLRSLTEALDNIADGIVIQDLDYRVLYENVAIRRAFGENTGKLCYEVYEGEKDVCEGCPMLPTLSGGTSNKTERRVETDDGIRYFELTTSPLRNESAEIIGGMKIARDITRQKEWEETAAEEAMGMKDELELIVNERTKDLMLEIQDRMETERRLKESEERFRILAGASLEGIVLSENGQIVDANMQFCELIGYSLQELIGMSILDYVSPASKSKVEEMISTENEQPYEHVIRRKDGREIIVEARGSNVPYEGRIVRVASVRDITDQRIAEKMLKDNVDRFELLFDKAPDAYYLLDMKGNFIDGNKAAEKLIGYKKEELIGKNFETAGILRLRDVPKALKMFGMGMLGRPTGPDELALKAKDGSTVYVEIISNPIKIDNKKVIIGIARDITARRKAEKALRDSEEKFRAIIENSQPIIFMIDNDGKFLLSEGKMLSVLGLKPGQVVGMSAYEMYKDFPAIINGINEALAGRYHQDIIDVNGIFFDIFYSPVKGSDGNISGLIGMAIDISDRVKAEEALRESEQRLFGFIDTLPVGIFVLDPSGVPVFANDKAKSLLGKDVMDIDKGELAEVYNAYLAGTDKLYPKEKMPIVRALRGETSHIDDMEIKRNDRIIPLEVLGYPVYDDNGEIKYAVASFLDISDRKKTEKEKEGLQEQLLRAQKIEAVGRLAGGIAHDFNNILSAMIANTNLIQLNMKNTDPSREYVDELMSLSERAISLTKSLLAFSRKQVITPKLADVNKIIDGIKNMLSRLIGEDISFDTYLSKEELMIMADTGQIEQVLVNIVTNSRDAMPKGGKLSIETSLDRIDRDFILHYGFGVIGEYALITIKDTGIGMTEEIKSKVFEPFFTSKDAARGTGLGLSTSYGIVKQHGGYINVESELDKGATFQVYLPIMEQEVAEDASAAVEIYKKVKRSSTILLAEDEEPVRKALRASLEAFGYKVIEAINGEDAVSKYKNNKRKVDFLLFDLIMPGMNGMEAFDEIKRISPQIKALFMSGYPKDILDEKGVSREELNFLYKPVTPGQLFRAMQEAMNK